MKLLLGLFLITFGLEASAKNVLVLRGYVPPIYQVLVDTNGKPYLKSNSPSAKNTAKLQTQDFKNHRLVTVIHP